MSNATDPKDYAELYRLCCDHGHAAVAHLITDAGQGEQWAIDRLAPAMVAVLAATSVEAMLEIVGRIDTTRPEAAGTAIARRTVSP